MFKQLFGEKPENIKPFCLLAPFYSPDLLRALKIPRLKKGTLYACGQNDELSFIHTRIGPTFLGDAVLYLKKTPCRDLVLLGACGAVSAEHGIDLGTLLIPSGCYAIDSFAEAASGINRDVPFYKSDAVLTEALILQAGSDGQPVKASASFASFYLETQYCDYFLKKEIAVVDLETAALFQTAALTGKRAAAVLYVTDMLNVHHPFRAWSSEEKARLRNAAQKAAKAVLQTARQQSLKDY